MMGHCDSAVNMLAAVHLHLPKIYRLFSDEWQFDKKISPFYEGFVFKDWKREIEGP